jgi:cellulose synthase/poly-beta-1,6-N-acetylglucosamine synthase-like glycosyltransferase
MPLAPKRSKRERRRKPAGANAASGLRILALILLFGFLYPLTVFAVAELPILAPKPWYVIAMIWALGLIIGVVVLYLARHYTFTLNRLFGEQRYPYVDVEVADWPAVTVLIPAHNEERVIGRILDALLACDYPRDRLTVLPISDRSKDKTDAILSQYARQNPNIEPFLRKEGEPGKGAALRDAMQLVRSDLVLVFDADYVPGHGLIKQLVAPFFDPEVGSVMGRVIPSNVQHNLLTRLLDLERSGGYQVDQQARMNLGLVPQYGGTVGGVRRSALDAVGGWRTDTLAEDTDATFRLLLGGWKTVYQNRSECYEEVPETWPVRLRQVVRWARGHNQSMARYAWPLLFNRRTTWRERMDGALLLGVYFMSPVMLVGWSLAMALWYLGYNEPGLLVLLAVAAYSTIGNFATFFEVAAATHLDGTRQRARLIPFIGIGFLVTILAVTGATLQQLLPRGNQFIWHRT